MSERPNADESPAELLLRRVSPRAARGRGDRVAQHAFQLRANRGERALSFYARSLLPSPAVILSGAPEPGWGVVWLRVDDLQALGFRVDPEPTRDPVLGHAHVAVTPPAFDLTGQIPQELLAAMTELASWVIPVSK